MKKIFFTLLITLWSSFLFAETPYYLDFNYILNESNAGKKAQTELKKKLESGLKSINQREKKEGIPKHIALDLTKGGKLATITLADKHYTLRITKSAKLILTK